jgi:hypothetical protein
LSDSNDGNGQKDPSTLTPRLDEDRPLDSMLPEMTERGARKTVGSDASIEKTSLHPRVLEVELEDSMEWALAAWEDPGQLELITGLRRLLEGTLLSEMSQPASREDLPERRFRAVELLVFDELFGETQYALGEMGFEGVDYRPDRYTERMDAWQEQAREIGHDVAGRPESVWRNEFETADSTIDEKLETIHDDLRRSLRDQVWGEQPGAPSKALAEKFRQHFNTSISPGPDGLDSFELFVVQEGGDYIRWMRPLVFQALCDFIGVVLQAHYGFQVDWAMCEPDDNGFVPPPLFRLRRGGQTQTFPVGLHVARWAMMPAATGDAGSIRAELEAALGAS